MSDTNQHNSSENARVQALLDSDRITQDEAEILFAALGEKEENVQAELTENSSEATSQPTFSGVPLAAEQPIEATVIQPVRPPQPPASAPPLPPQPPETSQTPPKIDSAVQQWVKLSGFCGDLSVEADPTLNSPVVTGKATLERTETGYLIRTPPEAKSEGNWLSRLHQAAGDVRVRLPADMCLDLRIAAGDGEVRGVKAVKGSFTGGDFRLTGAETLDLAVKSGDATLKLHPQTGEQRLRAIAGDINLTFLTGSSVAVSGKAKCGDLTLPQNFSRSGGFVGGNFEGTLGAGEARLELHLIAGDVTVRADV